VEVGLYVMVGVTEGVLIRYYSGNSSSKCTCCTYITRGEAGTECRRNSV
jgi:hypothetical protein